MTDQSEASAIWEKIRKQRVAMLTTEEGGALVSRPMSAIARPNEGKIYFVTHLSTGAVGDVGGSAPVNLAYSDPGNSDYISVSGTARTTQDREKLRELWSLWSEAWLPEGPDGADVALIEVTPTRAKLWDARSSKLIQTLETLSAVATQTPPDGGTVKEAALSQN
jgi:general stress protein 26